MKKQNSNIHVETFKVECLKSKNLYVLLPHSRIKTWASHSLLKNFNSHYLAQLNEQWKKEKDKKLTNPSPISKSDVSKIRSNTSNIFPKKALSATTEYGTHIHLQFFSKFLETYELHTWVCKTIKFPENHVGLYIKDLNTKLQTQLVEAVASFNEISQWKSPKYGKAAQKDTSQNEKKTITLTTSLSKPVINKMINKGLELGRANNLVRTLATTPSNFLTPKLYTNLIKDRATQKKYKMEFWSKKQLKTWKAGAFLSVAQGSKNRESGIVHLSYKPQHSKGKVALVGKGVCFDSGGYNIKTENYMLTMHRDMTGSAVALALFETLKTLKVPVEVHAYLGLVENLISEEASHPNEVVVASDGTSIEIINTDAEGRMVLADTLSLTKKNRPGLILDFATLTGGAVYSIGTQRSAIFSNHEKYLKLGYECGQLSGERVWGFPTGEDFKERLKSEVADTLQCSPQRGIDHILAATFLRKFVGEQIPWLHMDLSSESHTGGLGLVKTEVTGFGVRWGFEVIKSFYKLNV